MSKFFWWSLPPDPPSGSRLRRSRAPPLILPLLRHCIWPIYGSTPPGTSPSQFLLSSNDFCNTVASFFYQPHILQPSRITDHTATLIIDNILFHSIGHFTISGKVVYGLTDHLANFIILSNLCSLPSNI